MRKKVIYIIIFFIILIAIPITYLALSNEEDDFDIRDSASTSTSSDTSSPNLISNSNFESGNVGWVFNPGTAGSNSSGAVTSEESKNNDSSYKITINDANVWAVAQSDSIGNVSNGQIFTFSGWVKTSGDIVAIIKCQSTDDWTAYGVKQLKNSTDWQYVTNTFAVTNDHSGFQIVIGASNSQGTVYFDNIRLIQGIYNPDTYRGIARFGIGRLTDTFTNEQEMNELDDYKFGWFHNWFDRKDLYTSLGRNVSVELPESLDFYGLFGAWPPLSTDCSQSVKDKIADFKDGDVIWIGNEIGWGEDTRDPYTYASQYKSWYDCIKSVNPNIKVAPGANPGNPLFLYEPAGWINSSDPSGQGKWISTSELNYIDYIIYVKEEYYLIYGLEMPIDAYVIHNYPFNSPSWHDVSYMESTIRAFRQYMKDCGHEKKNLYIKEMGMLLDTETDMQKNSETLINTFEMLLNLRDNSIGNPNDNNRLVQRWAWYQAPTPCASPDYDYSGCMWPYTGFFKCHQISSWKSDCTIYREETYLANMFKEYVRQVWNTYDHDPPSMPVINYSLNGSSALVTFEAEDNGRINNYEISVGSTSGETDIMLWTSTDMQTSFTINDAVDKYINVKAIDDGYNWSNVSSILVEEQEESEGEEDEQEESEQEEDGQNEEAGNNYDIAPKVNPDGKVNIYDLQMILINWKWKREDRNEEADVNKDGEVNIYDVTMLLRHWTKKY